MILHLVKVNDKLECFLERAEAILAAALASQILFYVVTGDFSHAGMVANSVLILLVD